MGFYNPEDFPILLPLKENWEAIRTEFDTIANRAFVCPEPIHHCVLELFGLRRQDKELEGRQNRRGPAQRLSQAKPGHTKGRSSLC